MSLIEVAKVAGVSTATVSRVLNAVPGVRSETIALVRAAIDELNYKPPLRPQSVSEATAKGDAPRRRRLRAPTGKSQRALTSEVGLRTGNIGVITVGHSSIWLQLPVMAAALSGIQRGVGELGLQLMLEEMRDPTQPTNLVRRGLVDGVVVFLAGDLSASVASQALRSIRACVPCVRAMGFNAANDSVDHVTIDNVAVGNLAASHLLSEGCRHLAFLTDEAAWPLVRLRGQSFLNRARDERVDSAVAYLSGADAAAVAAGYGPDAVVAANLDLLVGQIAADIKRREGGSRLGLFVYNYRSTAKVFPHLARHGLLIGEHVELISCDAERARLDAIHPRPASIDPGAEEIGFRAVVRLLARIQRPNDPLLTIQVAPRL